MIPTILVTYHMYLVFFIYIWLHLSMFNNLFYENDIKKRNGKGMPYLLSFESGLTLEPCNRGDRWRPRKERGLTSNIVLK